jgi:hypothetical protein
MGSCGPFTSTEAPQRSTRRCRPLPGDQTSCSDRSWRLVSDHVQRVRESLISGQEDIAVGQVGTVLRVSSPGNFDLPLHLRPPDRPGDPVPQHRPRLDLSKPHLNEAGDVLSQFPQVDTCARAPASRQIPLVQKALRLATFPVSGIWRSHCGCSRQISATAACAPGLAPPRSPFGVRRHASGAL